jgi:hypothetical protein
MAERTVAEAEKDAGVIDSPIITAAREKVNTLEDGVKDLQHKVEQTDDTKDPVLQREKRLVPLEAKENELKRARSELSLVQAKQSLAVAQTEERKSNCHVDVDMLAEKIEVLDAEWEERYAERKSALEKAFPLMRSSTTTTSLHPLPFDQVFTLPVFIRTSRPYVDDGNRLPQIVHILESTLSQCVRGSPRAADLMIPVITGHPGIGKTRLAIEVANCFAEVSPDDRFVIEFPFRVGGRVENLQGYLSFTSLDTLAAVFLVALFDLNPTKYSFGWESVVELIQSKFSTIRVFVLVIDHFSSALSVAERVVLACGAWNTEGKQQPFYVLPLFAGGHRMRQPPLGSMSLQIFTLKSLSVDARKQYVENVAGCLQLPSSNLRKCLGTLFDACGGWPSFLSSLHHVLQLKEFKPHLESIRARGELGADTGKNLWNELVSHFRCEITITGFAELIMSSKEASYSYDSKPYVRSEQEKTKSFALAKLALDRLKLLAITRIPVILSGSILNKEDHPHPDDGDISEITFSLAASHMVEVQHVGEDDAFGYVIMPVFAIASIIEAIGINRHNCDLLNPFATPPPSIEVLAIESIYSRLQVYRNLRYMEIELRDLRPGVRCWGRSIKVRVPEMPFIITLADRFEVAADEQVFHTDLNGKRLPVTLQEGACFIRAPNHEVTDGGIILKEAGTLVDCIVCSQSKFQLEHIDQSARDGGDATIARQQALTIIQTMRNQSQTIKHGMGISPERRVLMVYDVFPTREIGERLEKLENAFEPDVDEVIFLTTKDCVESSLGPVLSLRCALKDE